jgi:acetoin utilization deacetylase AcuC-like enzyme
MPVAIISHPDCAHHNMGEFHPESPSRLSAIQDRLISSGLDFVVRQLDAKPIDLPLLELVHDKHYIDYIIANAPTVGYFELDPDTRMNPFTLNAALLSAGAAVDAVDLVMAKKMRSVFCATRPPGHHAERDKAMGFCIFNNVALAAAYAKQKYNLQRVAVVDFDVHHGNGTENILRDKNGYLFCSIFQHPFYPFSGTENSPEHIINSPLPATASSADFRQKVTEDWLPALNKFKPEILFISAGFDAHAEDEISQMRLYENDYRWVTEQLVIVAEKYSQGRIVSVLEGGYSLGALGRSVVAHINGLIGN